MLNNNKIKYLGNMQVPALGMGCVNLSGLYGKVQEDPSDILSCAIEHGVNFLDTADVYANGENEKLIASSLQKGRIERNRVIISTKCGVVWDRENSLINSVDNSPAYIKSACEASLKRLNTDYIDLYYLHRISCHGEIIEESVNAMRELVKEGKIRHIGLSEVNSEIIRRAHTVYHLTAIQSEYSLLTRNVEVNDVLSTCRELNIGFVAYSPLCRGLLSSNFNSQMLEKDDFRHKFPRFKKDNLSKNMTIVNKLEEISKNKGCSVVQLSLAWVLAQGNDVLPIPGTKCTTHLMENIASSHIDLDCSELAILSEIFPAGVASGERYSPAILRSFNLSEEI